ncbi:unnamed protein product [Linum tenue]|uniref:TIR domain-containing protein n=1 Tax=Linum tenue TaxID=586396 RepID=A0AAV0PDL9_9ROSI|nr:unnamed protein product [Linum tenue]
MEPIASSSSSSSSSTCSTLPSLLPAREYEVFLSFRGFDVRNTFSDHLYASLSRSKIRAFRDEEELPKGEEISPSLIRAIGESKIYIPIFSENYASSKWCLQELAQMVECCKREKGHLFLPIFYLVDPRDVRHQQGPYEQAFEQHAQKHSSHTVQGWKEALQVVGKMKGWHVTESNGQGVVINEVLSKIELHLRRIYRLVTDELVGIDTHVEEVVKLLNLGSNNPKVIGIHGMGGIGKTTLSKAVYNKISAQFDRCCFLEGVKETLTRNDGVISLQNKIISSILRQDYQVENMSEGINVIKERVCKHKLILVLDDVDDKFEFDQILGKLRDFSLESRFIFTTRNKSKHAFRTDHPPKEDAVISKEFVKVAAGLPLALKVMGSLLFHRERRFWEDKLKQFKGILSLESEVSKIMKISYDELTPTEKQIFLDIACLFIGSKKEALYNMWNACSFHPESGINTLVDRSLMKLDEDNRFWMHDHIRDLGRAIVQEEDIRHPHRRSRIWSEKDAMDLLRNNERLVSLEHLSFEGCTSIRKLPTDMSKLRKLEHLNVRRCTKLMEATGIEGLESLRLLDMSGCSSITKLGDLSGLKNLVELHMKKCTKLTRVTGIDRLETLRALKMSGCRSIKQLGDLSGLENLHTLDISGCIELTEVKGIERLPSLEYLWMSDCRSIKELGNLSGLRKLRQFHIRGCTELTEVKGLERLQSLEYLWMSDCRSIKELGDLSRMKKLREFDIRGCTQLAQVKGLEELKWLWDPRMDKRLKVKYLWERYGERQVNRVVRFAHEKHLRRRHSRNGAQPLSPGKT